MRFMLKMIPRPPWYPPPPHLIRPRPSAAPWIEKAKKAHAVKELDLVSGKEALLEDHEELIAENLRLLKRHLPAPLSGKWGGSSGGERWRWTRSGKRCPEWTLSTVEVRELRYSQESCKATFHCGRSVFQLVQELLDRKVRLSARFLTLDAYDDTDTKTGEPILKCIDNRRLFALREYAIASGKDRVMVNVKIFNISALSGSHPIAERIMNNSDDTDGRDIRLRGRGKKRKSNSDDTDGRDIRLRGRGKKRKRSSLA